MAPGQFPGALLMEGAQARHCLAVGAAVRTKLCAHSGRQAKRDVMPEASRKPLICYPIANYIVYRVVGW